MNILAIDTAQGACSACIVAAGVADPVVSESIFMSRGHAEALLPMVDRLIARLNGGFDGLDRIAVSIGPGSFTGIRVGIAAARALGLACEIPVVGVSTLSALAAPLVAETDNGVVAAVIDALHGNVYMQAFVGGGRTLVAPRLLPAREAVRLLGSGPIRLTGSGAPILAIEAWSMGLKAEVTGALVAPDIVYIARLGLLSDPAAALPTPCYLKPPDAVPQHKGRIARAP
jgi:tRNA threonylcarbamoyladenosine biosynthesis protein TsaB